MKQILARTSYFLYQPIIICKRIQMSLLIINNGLCRVLRLWVNSVFSGVHCGTYSCNGEIKNIKSISIANTLQQCTPIRAVSSRVQILMLKHATPPSNYV